MDEATTTTVLQEPVAKQKHHGPPKAVIILLLLLVAGGTFWYFWQKAHPPENTAIVDVSGRIEGYETNLGPKIGGRVDWVGVREGNAIKVGQLVARLSDADYQAQLRGAEARIKKAQQAVEQNQDQISVVKAQIGGATKRLAQSREESNAQIAQSTASMEESQARYEQAKAEYQQSKYDLELAAIRLERYTNLVKKGAVTKDEYDQARTTYSNATELSKSRAANVVAAQRAVSAAKASLSQAQAARFTPPIRSSDVNVFQAQLDQAAHQLGQAQHEVDSTKAERDRILADIAYLNIVSPINGVVTARAVEPGAVVVPGQTILTGLDYTQVYMRAFVPEGRIGAVRVGGKATVYLDAFPNKAFEARVIEIDPQASFTPENIYFKDDRVKQVFGIKLGIEKPDGYAKPGMPADAQISL
jgi:HlyD family secretion protein